MILDRLENAKRYESLHPGLAKAFAFLNAADLASFDEGRHEIEGDRVFLMVACGEGRGRPNAKLEAHRRYADIQITVRGTEEIGYKPTAGCTEPEAPFDENKDAILFRDAPEVWTPLAEGMFAVYFPEDAHAPMAGQGSVRKAVIKVLL